MADGALKLTPGQRLGTLAAILAAALTIGPLGAVLVRADGLPRLAASDWSAIRFTVLQATLSALLSVALAVPVARALARRQFLGRSAIITLLGAPFILPVIVAVFGLLAVFGRSGLLNSGLAALGFPPLSIYGLQGVVLAHVFFNMPLAVRLLLHGWLAIPAERFRLAASLSMQPRDVRRWIERPMLWQVVPGALMIVFLICLTSFAVALTLGGGPRATTIELAIYQAFRFDFDLDRAAALASVQFCLTAVTAIVALRIARAPGFGGGLDRIVERWDAGGRLTHLTDATTILIAVLFLLGPLTMIVFAGLPGILELPSSVLRAAVTSILVALASVCMTFALALPLTLSSVAVGAGAGRGIEAAGYLGMAISPLVVGTGLFLITFPFVDPARIALLVTAASNALLSLPFALRVLVPAARAIEDDYGRLADSLGLQGTARLRWLVLPRLRRQIGFAAGLSAALSMGDLGVIALFADTETATLPLQLYRLMGAYRMEDAAGTALLLLTLSLLVFWIFDRGGRANAPA